MRYYFWCLIAQSCPTLCKPMDCSPPGSSVHGDSLGKNIRMGCHAVFQQGRPNPGTEYKSPELQVNSLLSEPPEKPMNNGVGSLSLLQGIFPIQESNWGLLHCRQILYQLSYQGSPSLLTGKLNAKSWTDLTSIYSLCSPYPLNLWFSFKEIPVVSM